MPATKGESELLQNYFDDRRPGYLIGIVEDALSAHARKKREERNARQAAETQKLFENLPEPPEDFSKQVLKVCSDAGFLWVTNDKQGVIEPGGVEKKILIQRARCDSCGGEYTPSELLKHKSTAVCECCGEKMRVRNTRYSVKRLWAARTFLWCKPQGMESGFAVIWCASISAIIGQNRNFMAVESGGRTERPSSSGNEVGAKN